MCSAHNTAYPCVWQNNERRLLLLTKLERKDEQIQTSQTFFWWVFFALTNHVSNWYLNSSAPFGDLAFYFSSCCWKWEVFSAAMLLDRVECPPPSGLMTGNSMWAPTSRWRHSSAPQRIVRPWHQTSSCNPGVWLLPKGQFDKGAGWQYPSLP